jgi:hypothetical protein
MKYLFSGLLDYILILGFTAIAIYIIYNKIIKNRKTTSENPPFNNTPNSKQTSELSSVEQSDNGVGIMNTSFSSTEDNALRNYIIKSSSDSAYTGGYMNLNMIKYVISRGCRFLDFEVYMKDDVPIVAYSSNKSSIDSFTSESPAVSLAGVCSTIMSNAFSDKCPNERDPIFIHLRIKTYVSTAYSQIAKIIKGTMGNKLHTQGNGQAVPVTLDTQLPELAGKVIIIVDQTSSPGYQNYSTCAPDNTECVNLTDCVNMNSNSQNIRVYHEHDLTAQPINPPDPSVYLLRIVLPKLGFFNNVSNSNALYLFENYGAQMVAQAFYMNDMNLKEYEDFFKYYKSAFVNLANGVQYSREKFNN